MKTCTIALLGAALAATSGLAQAAGKDVTVDDTKIFTGIADDALLIDENIGGVQTPAQLYHLVEQLIAPQTELVFRSHDHKAA